MKRAMIPIAILALAGVMAAQTAAPPPPPPQTPQPAAPAQAPEPRPKPRVKPKVQAYGYSGLLPANSSGSYLGVDVRDVSPERVQTLKLKSDQGVEITMVDQDGPAGKAGLKEHDVVVSFNGQNVQSAEQLRRLIRETKPGQNVSLGLMRDGQPTSLSVTLADRSTLFSKTAPKVWSGPNKFVVRVPDIEIPSFVISSSSRRNGATVENLTAQLGEYFGVKGGQGVLVRSVEKGSKAEAAGLKAGDVIIRVDNDTVSDTREWSRLLRNKEGTVKIGIIRDRREQTLSMAIPERKADESGFWYVGPDADEVHMELERLGPQFSRERAELQRRIGRELASHQREIQQAMREAQREVERSMRELENDKDHLARDAQREKQRALRDLQREKERLEREKSKEPQDEID